MLKHHNGLSTSLAGISHYGIFSNEIDREIVLANGSLPDRDYVYDHDVMVVRYDGEYGQSTRIIMPEADREFDLTLNAPKIIPGDLIEYEPEDEINPPIDMRKP